MMCFDIQSCPEAAKFRLAPLQDEEDMKIIFDKNAVTNITARVPPSSQSRINIDEDVGSGCEGEESLALFLWMLGAPESNSQAADRFERSVSIISRKFHQIGRASCRERV